MKSAFLSDSEIERASQHLLRNLNDARALSSNPLVASLFTSESFVESNSNVRGSHLAVIHDFVRTFCDELRSDCEIHPHDVSLKRQCEILRRCDIGGEPHASAAAALGLSIRQFYRERRGLAGRVGASLIRHLQTLKRVVPTTLPGVSGEWLHKELLVLSGKLTEAEGFLSGLMDTQVATLERQFLWRGLIRLALREENVVVAQQRIVAALRELARDRTLKTAERLIFKIELLAQWSEVLHLAGNASPSEAVDRAIIKFLAQLGSDHRYEVAVVHVTLRLAHRSLLRGDETAALRLLQHPRTANVLAHFDSLAAWHTRAQLRA